METVDSILTALTHYGEAHPLPFALTKGLAIVIISLPFGYIVRFILRVLQDRIFSKTDNQIDDQINGILKTHVVSFVFTLGLKYALMEVQLGLPEGFTRTNEAITLLRHLVFIALVFIVARVIGKIIRDSVDFYLRSLPSHLDPQQIASIAPFIRRGLQLVSISIVLVIVLDHFDINIGSLLVSLGVGSLAVALAAQDTIANIIAGIIITVDKPFRVGDRIQLNDGKLGDIFEIGLRSTRIKDFDNNLLIIPNAELIRTRIINFSYPDAPIRVLVFFNVPLGTDLNRVRELVVALALENPFYNDFSPSGMQVIEFNESGINCRLETFVTDFTRRFESEVTLREKIHETLLKHGISIAFPRRLLTFTSDLKGTSVFSQTPPTTTGYNDSIT